MKGGETGGHLVDLRMLDLAPAQAGLTRGPGGALVYIGGVKKALLQSCPYLVMLAVPIAMLLRGAKHGPALGMLLLAPAAFVAPYAFHAWHGGLGLNLRYFLPILPFTSILAAFAWREVTLDLGASRLRPAAVAAGAAIAFYAIIVFIGPALLWGPMTVARQESVFLTLPLGIAACASVLLLAHLTKPGLIPRQVLPAVLAVGLVWSGLVAFTYDFPRAYASRKDQAAISHILVPFIEQDSLVITFGAHYFSALPADRRVRIAKPQRDDFKDFHPLAAFHLDRNRAVYVWVNALMEKYAQERGLFHNYAVVPVYEHPSGTLVRLLWPPGERGAGSADSPP